MTSRRRFLAQSGAGLVVLSGIAGSGCDVLFRPGPRAVAAELIGMLDRPGLARRIGRAYIQARGATPPSLEALTQELMEALGIRLESLTMLPVDNLANAVSARVRRDFADETVIALDGWLLSQAEARMCGILYLYEA